MNPKLQAGLQHIKKIIVNFIHSIWRILHRYHPHIKPYYPHIGAFIGGVVLSSMFFVLRGGTTKTTPVSADATAASIPIDTDAVDWSDLVINMCRPDSEINRLAMKFDFPFERCQADDGQINRVCVEKDAVRFKPNLSAPYTNNLGELQVKLNTYENGKTDMHYILPLKKAAYQGMPLTALAVRIETDASNELQGWQTPYLVIQDDFSKIRSVLKQNGPSVQTVYFADIPPEKDILSGPFDTAEQARAISKKAGGNPEKITSQIMKPEVNFNDKLNAVTLSCVSQPIDKK